MFDRGLKTHIIDTRSVRRDNARDLRTLKADICVLGAGISGVAAALEAAKLGRKVVLVDGAPALGGQAIGSIIGTLIGLYTHGPKPYQITHGIADELIADLDAEGSLVTYRNITVTYQYDELRLARWMERKVQAAGIQAVVGAVLTDVGFANRRVSHIDFATRFGGVRVAGAGLRRRFGRRHARLARRAAGARAAGADLRHAQLPHRGLRRGQYRRARHAGGTREAEGMRQELRADAPRRPPDALPEQGFHAGEHQPLRDAARSRWRARRMVFEGRRQADATIEFLRREFPRIFANARVRAYGNPGIRQTRWIVGKSAAHACGHPLGAAPRRCGRALRLVGGAARHGGAGALGAHAGQPCLLRFPWAA